VTQPNTFNTLDNLFRVLNTEDARKAGQQLGGGYPRRAHRPAL
jgi:hypothetical protein